MTNFSIWYKEKRQQFFDFSSAIFFRCFHCFTLHFSHRILNRNYIFFILRVQCIWRFIWESLSIFLHLFPSYFWCFMFVWLLTPGKIRSPFLFPIIFSSFLSAWIEWFRYRKLFIVMMFGVSVLQWCIEYFSSFIFLHHQQSHSEVNRFFCDIKKISFAVYFSSAPFSFSFSIVFHVKVNCIIEFQCQKWIRESKERQWCCKMQSEMIHVSRTRLFIHHCRHQRPSFQHLMLWRGYRNEWTLFW